MDSKPLKPFFSYYGSKWRLAGKYPQPNHTTVIEPFAGSAAYSLYYPDRNVILCDVNPVISGIWRWLIDEATPDLILSLPRLSQGESLDDFTFPCQQAKDLMGFWVNQAAATPHKVMTSSAANRAVRDYHGRVASQLDRIRHWQVRQCDYTQLSNQDATWFVDPPYQREGNRYVFGAERIDYGELGYWCMSRLGQCIVCESAGAEWLPFVSLVVNQGMNLNNGTAKVTEEMIWIGELADDRIALSYMDKLAA